EQVPNHLLQAIGVAGDLPDVAVEAGVARDALDFPPRARDLLPPLGQIRPLPWAGFPPPLSAAGARGIKQVLDPSCLPARAPLNDFVAAMIELLVAATLTQDASPAEDGVQRRAQFVGDQSNELVLRPVGALGLAARLSLSRQSLFESLLGLLAAGDIND